ncbi:MAG: hypothetical protein FVQ82_16035 [Planctomycetes bacterium]|nr:hypothetical protein [Planctomycetota bacterium]
MSTKKISKLTTDAGECLKKAVREEFRKKALLGQYVIISRNGKACRIPAKEALEIAEGKSRIKKQKP